MKNSELSSAAAALTADDFVQDPKVLPIIAPAVATLPDQIDGVTLTPLISRNDDRGGLTVLLTTHGVTIEPIVHVYWVVAKAGSVRAWVYHRLQYDRLSFTNGKFRIVLFDIRPESPTFNKLSVFTVGAERPCLLRIPPYVVHGVHNIGSEDASFVNMPTKAYDPDNPDKARLPIDDPRIPFSFDE